MTTDPHATIIGFTDYDLRLSSGMTRWAFGQIVDQRTAVISTARMEIDYPDRPVSDELVKVRLRKMTTRYLANTFFRIPPNNDPLSILYVDICGIDDLDRLRDGLRTH